jgi:hypothetical protein
MVVELGLTVKPKEYGEWLRKERAVEPQPPQKE